MFNIYDNLVWHVNPALCFYHPADDAGPAVHVKAQTPVQSRELEPVQQILLELIWKKPPKHQRPFHNIIPST